MKWSTAICWTLVLLLAVFFEGISCKGGRGGARGAARGSSRGSTRRSKSSTRYSSSGTGLRVAVAAAAAGGAAAGAASAVAAGRMWSAGEGGPEYAEAQSGNSTGEGNYNYRAWTSVTGPKRPPAPTCLSPCARGTSGPHPGRRSRTAPASLGPALAKETMSSAEAPSGDPQEEAAVEVPAVEVPDVEVPAVEVPDVEVPAVEIPAVEVAKVPIEENAIHIPAPLPPPSSSGERERGPSQRTGWLLDLLDDVRYLISCTNWY
nr:shadow of prion protein [Zootoca vivipara]